MQLILLMPQAREPTRTASSDTSPPATPTGPCSSLSTARTRCPPGCARPGSRSSSVAGRRPRASATSTSTTGPAPRARSSTCADTGRRRIATIAGPQDMAAGVDRLLGYHDRLADGRRSALTRAWSRSPTSRTRAAAPRWSGCSIEHPSLDAVFVASDLMAIGALAALRAAGRSIPDDVAVVGFDDSQLCLTAEPEAVQRAPADRGDGPRDGAAAACRRSGFPDRASAPRDPRHPAHRARFDVDNRAT